MIPLQLKLTLESPLHIGGEVRHNTHAKRPMLKTRTGLPYVPATSIKGRLRHETEKLIRHQMGADAVCGAPRPQYMCQPVTDDGAGACPVCALFGSPWFESPLRFSDLTLAQESLNLLEAGRSIPPTHNRAGIRINRRRRVVEDEFLFDTELFEPGIPWVFEGRALFDGVLDELVPLYFAAAALTMLGGSRSRGLGWCQLIIEPDHGLLSRGAWQTWMERHQ